MHANWIKGKSVKNAYISNECEAYHSKPRDVGLILMVGYADYRPASGYKLQIKSNFIDFKRNK